MHQNTVLCGKGLIPLQKSMDASQPVYWNLFLMVNFLHVKGSTGLPHNSVTFKNQTKGMAHASNRVPTYLVQCIHIGSQKWVKLTFAGIWTFLLFLYYFQKLCSSGCSKVGLCGNGERACTCTCFWCKPTKQLSRSVYMLSDLWSFLSQHQQ